jgi:tetratricopeptide (TPR) repeat protein
MDTENSTITEGKKSINIKLIIGILLIFVCIIVCVILALHQNSSKSFIEYIQDGDYDKAITLYSKKIDGNINKENEVSMSVDEFLNNLIDMFNRSEITEADLQTKISAVEKTNLFDDKVDDFNTKIENLKESKNNYQEAVKLKDSDNYTQIIDFCSKVSEEDINYENAQQLIENTKSNCKNNFVNAVNTLVQSGDYIGALNNFNSVPDIIKDDSDIAELQESTKASYSNAVYKNIETYMYNKTYTLGIRYIDALPDLFANDSKIKDYRSRIINCVRNGSQALGCNFGMTQEEVKLYIQDGAVLSADMDDILIYNISIDGVNFKINFSFNYSGQLYSIIGESTDYHSNGLNYVNDYNSVKSYLTTKYGSPKVDKKIYTNRLFEDDPSYDETALAMGYLVYGAKWDTRNMEITNCVYGENAEISVLLSFKSTTYSE